MIKIFVCFAFMLAVSTATAETHDWQITEVSGANNTVAGYIYHIGSIGTQVTKAEKIATSLRIVCSATAPTDSPLITIFWNTMTGNTSQLVETRVNGRIIQVGQPQRWDQDGPLLIRQVSESRELVMALKSSKDIEFMWISPNGVRRITMFDLRNFNIHLHEFNALCKSNL